MARYRDEQSVTYRKYADEQAERVYQELNRQQSPHKANLAAMFGVIVSVVFLYGCEYFDYVWIWMLFFPSLLIGYCAQIFGKVYLTRYTIIPALLATALQIFAVFVMFNFDSLAVITVPISFLVTLFLSKIKLSQVQQRALWRKQLGKF